MLWSSCRFARAAAAVAHAVAHPLPGELDLQSLPSSGTTSNTSEPCTELFCPIYSLGLSPDPLLSASAGAAAAPSDVYLAVGLDSGLTPQQFKRKQLNLVRVPYRASLAPSLALPCL